MTFLKKKSAAQATAFAINQAAINAVTVDFADANSPRLVRHLETPIDPEEGTKQLKTFAKNQRLNKQPCSICLDLGEYQLIPMDAPDIPEDELADALKWGMTEFTDIPTDDMVIDFFDVPGTRSSGDGRHVNVVVVNKSTIEEKATQFKQAGLKLKVIDIPELAIRNLINAYRLDEEGVVFLYIAKTSGLIVFVRDKQIYFSRNLEVGSEQLLQNKEVQQNIALEVQRSLDYFDRHYSAVAIKRLVIAPTEPAMPGLASFLDENLAISCVNFDLNKGLGWTQEHEQSVHPMSVLSLGAALRVDEDQ